MRIDIEKFDICGYTEMRTESELCTIAIKMTAKKVVELFYDVSSPYSWFAFEVGYS